VAGEPWWYRKPRSSPCAGFRPATGSGSGVVRPCRVCFRGGKPQAVGAWGCKARRGRRGSGSGAASCNYVCYARHAACGAWSRAACPYRPSNRVVRRPLPRQYAHKTNRVVMGRSVVTRRRSARQVMGGVETNEADSECLSPCPLPRCCHNMPEQRSHVLWRACCSRPPASQVLFYTCCRLEVARERGCALKRLRWWHGQREEARQARVRGIRRWRGFVADEAAEAHAARMVNGRRRGEAPRISQKSASPVENAVSCPVVKVPQCRAAEGTAFCRQKLHHAGPNRTPVKGFAATQ